MCRVRGLGSLYRGCVLNLCHWGWETVALDADQQRSEEGEVSRKEGSSALHTAAKGKRPGPGCMKTGFLVCRDQGLGHDEVGMRWATVGPQGGNRGGGGRMDCGSRGAGGRVVTLDLVDRKEVQRGNRLRSICSVAVRFCWCGDLESVRRLGWGICFGGGM